MAKTNLSKEHTGKNKWCSFEKKVVLVITELGEKGMDFSHESKRNYHKVGNSHIAWKLSAQDLLISSEFLFQQYKTIDPSNVSDHIKPEGRVLEVLKMLRGMALECLFKAIYLKNGGRLVKDGKYRKIPDTNDHDLVLIAENVLEPAGFAITENQNEILKKLSSSIVGGRYPIHRIWEPKKMNIHSNTGLFQNMWSIPDDEDIFEDFVCLLQKLLEGE